MKKFSAEEISDYAAYIGDSYTHVRNLVNEGEVKRIIQAFYEINDLIEEAEKRYAKTR